MSTVGVLYSETDRSDPHGQNSFLMSLPRSDGCKYSNLSWISQRCWNISRTLLNAYLKSDGRTVALPCPAQTPLWPRRRSTWRCHSRVYQGLSASVSSFLEIKQFLKLDPDWLICSKYRNCRTRQSSLHKLAGSLLCSVYNAAPSWILSLLCWVIRGWNVPIQFKPNHAKVLLAQLKCTIKTSLLLLHVVFITSIPLFPKKWHFFSKTPKTGEKKTWKQPLNPKP